MSYNVNMQKWCEKFAPVSNGTNDLMFGLEKDNADLDWTADLEKFMEKEFALLEKKNAKEHDETETVNIGDVINVVCNGKIGRGIVYRKMDNVCHFYFDNYGGDCWHAKSNAVHVREDITCQEVANTFGDWFWKDSIMDYKSFDLCKPECESK